MLGPHAHMREDEPMSFEEVKDEWKFVSDIMDRMQPVERMSHDQKLRVGITMELLMQYRFDASDIRPYAEGLFNDTELLEIMKFIATPFEPFNAVPLITEIRANATAIISEFQKMTSPK